MKYMIAALLLMISATSTFAQQVFFSAPSVRGSWDVQGDVGDSTLNPACRMQTNWQDGSFFTLIKDLKDGELYILMQVNTWNIIDPPGSIATARFNFHSGNTISGGPATYELLNKNTVRFRGLHGERFLPDFDRASSLTIVMPNTIPNAFINLKGTSDALEAMSACMKAYKSAPQNKPGINL
jgi:hypothetical protein